MVPRPDDAPPSDAPPIAADAVIIGAGPVGLFQVFELGLLDIRAHVVDSLPRAGGQPVELYPDKPIYDIPGTQVCTGRELADALLRQIAPFTPAFHLGQEITQLEPQPDGRFLLASSAGTRWLARCVFIAAGVGAFQPRALKVAGAAEFEGTQIVYRAGDPGGYAGRQVVVHGGEDAALEAALALARQDGASRPARVTLLHRRDVFQAAPETVAAVRALREAGRLDVRIGQITGLDTQAGRLTGLQVTDADGVTAVLPADAVIALLGLSPRLGPVAQWGLAIERKQLRVDTEKFATDVPGIFAVGDINTYPGKKKLILSGFHEAALAAFGAAAHLHPDRPVHLQYTTTSPRLHALLGVGTAGEGFDKLSPNGAEAGGLRQAQPER